MSDQSDYQEYYLYLSLKKIKIFLIILYIIWEKYIYFDLYFISKLSLELNKLVFIYIYKKTKI